MIKTNKERLASIETDLKYLREGFENHLSTHTKYTYLAFTTTIGMIITLILTFIKIY